MNKYEEPAPHLQTEVTWTPRDLNISKECKRRLKQAEREAAKEAQP